MEAHGDASMVPDNPMVNIADDGDIIMVVGPKKKKYRLHSLFLKTTSKVFKVMLGPKFAEGQRLIANDANGNSEPVKIDLPQDDTESMEFIFRAVHHKFDAVENRKGLPFFEILVAAEKYDLVPAVKCAFHHALAVAVEKEETLKRMSRGELWKLAMASAFVTNAPAFKAATRALILYCDKRYLDCAQQWFFNEVFALHICAALHEERAVCKDRAMNELLTACLSPHTIEGRFEIDVERSDAFIYASLDEQLDLIRSCREWQESDEQRSFYSKHRIDEIKQDAGLDLARFA